MHTCVDRYRQTQDNLRTEHTFLHELGCVCLHFLADQLGNPLCRFLLVSAHAKAGTAALDLQGITPPQDLPNMPTRGPNDVTLQLEF